MKARSPDRADRDLPAGLTRASEIPNLSHSDPDTAAAWVAYFAAARPRADVLRLLLAAPGVTVGDALDDPTGFPTD